MECMSEPRRRPGRPKKGAEPAAPAEGRGPVLYLRLGPELNDALQRFIAAQRIKPDRTAVGLTALEELLSREGYWPPPK